MPRLGGHVARCAAAVLTALVVLKTSTAPAYAVPPPPADPQAQEQTAAIDALKPFLGCWSGVEAIPGPQGIDPLSVFRDVERVGDVIVMAMGYQHVAQVNVVSYAPMKHAYRLFMPGYRHTFLAVTDEVIVLGHPGAQTIQWSEPDALFSASAQNSYRQFTVTVENRQWRETVKSIEPDGKIVPQIEYTLHQTGTADNAGCPR